MGMVTIDKYFNRFIKMIQEPKYKDKNGEQVYEDLEKWHEKKTGKRRCKDYNSFKSYKSQYYKMNR
jgi:hypothetical protein